MFSRKPHNNPHDDGRELVHTKRVTLRNGRVLKAEDYGLRCFTFWAKPRRKK